MGIDSTSPTREINKRLLLTLHQDGLLDVLAGLIVITFGFIPILDETSMSPVTKQIDIGHKLQSSICSLKHSNIM